jgi:hypothetical protein
VEEEVVMDGRVWGAHEELHEHQESDWPGCLRIRYYWDDVLATVFIENFFSNFAWSHLVFASLSALSCR